MKYSIFLSLISIVLVTTSCDKESDDPTGLTPNDLVGDWNFQSLTFNNFVYDTEPELAALDVDYNFIQLSFLNVTTTELGLYDLRSYTLYPYTKNYTLSNNTISFDNDRFVFYIENWETFDGSILMVKFISCSSTNQAPINGVFTMTK